ncbi:uncharacterized protein MYCFIDRAFT_84301 [Pseudocercospora fijiensis CIRAD86]|uniref:Thiamine pyrophosphate enzyme TPP-binding domain-containing protein n=1 Tax=Pseudocercospora fijiensis (strain CIRAD86) TaxID=383855 RepID=M3AJK2_PSEFD|nr:uncharacterized protein MYCFIDRAFT_84301 [Pseudocercospora fijiensis CIRAD86]EME77652.1 hypothetical protein MYCFIDRAFT_84301 [Pseudocercospora fijiensis CIRAD86]
MAIFNAFCDRVPILMLGATGPLDATKRRPWIDWIHTAQDQGALIRPYIKFDDQPHSPQAAIESLIHAYVATKTKPSAPTYICLDHTLQETEINAKEISFPNPSRYLDAATHPQMPSSDIILRIESELSASKKPLFMFGRPPSSSSSKSLISWQKRIQLAEKFDARVLTDIKQSATFPTHHHLHVTPPGIFLEEESCEQMREADLIVSFDWVDLAGSLGAAGVDLESRVRIVHVSMDSGLHNGWSKDHFAIPPADVFVNADGDGTVAAILAATHDFPDRRSLWHTAEPSVQEPLENRKESSDNIFMSDLAHAIYATIPPDEICLVRVPLGWSGRDLRITHPLGFMGMDGAAGIGSGCGQIVGTSLALRSSSSNLLPIGVLGDGDFLMGSSALWTAAKYKLPCLVIVANNGSYYNDEMHQERVARVRGREVRNKGIGMRLTGPRPECGRIAEGLGCAVVREGRVEGKGELVGVMRRAVEMVREGGVVVLDVDVKPDGYGEVVTLFTFLGQARGRPVDKSERLARHADQLPRYLDARSDAKQSRGAKTTVSARSSFTPSHAGSVGPPTNIARSEAPSTPFHSEECARFALRSLPAQSYPHFICPKQAVEASLSSNSSRSVKAASHFDYLKLVAKVCPRDYAICYIFKYLRFLSFCDLGIAYDVCSELVVASVLGVAQEQLLYSTSEFYQTQDPPIDSPHQQPRPSHGACQSGGTRSLGFHGLGKSFGYASSGRGTLKPFGPGRGRRGRDDPPNGVPRSEERKAGSRGMKWIPCICHIAEPSVYGHDTTKYEYMSQLERHLKSHNIYICCHCLEKFDGSDKAEAISSKQQWEAIFRLQYPGKPIPNGVFDEADILNPFADFSQSSPRPWSSHTATITSMDEDTIPSDESSHTMFLSALNGESSNLEASEHRDAPSNAPLVQQGWHSERGSIIDQMDYVQSLATSDANSDQSMGRALHAPQNQASPSTETAAPGLPTVALNEQSLFGPFADNVDPRELTRSLAHDAAEDVRLFSNEPVLQSTVTNLTQAVQIARLTEEVRQLRQEQTRLFQMMHALQAAFPGIPFLHQGLAC